MILDHRTLPSFFRNRPHSSLGCSRSRYSRSLTNRFVIEFASLTSTMSVLSMPSRISNRAFSKQAGSELNMHGAVTITLLGYLNPISRNSFAGSVLQQEFRARRSVIRTREVDEKDVPGYYSTVDLHYVFGQPRVDLRIGIGRGHQVLGLRPANSGRQDHGREHQRDRNLRSSQVLASKAGL